MLLRSVDRLPGLAGRVARGGRLNPYKAAAESTVARAGARLIFTAGPGEVNDVLVTSIITPTAAMASSSTGSPTATRPTSR